MTHRIEVCYRKDIKDLRGTAIASRIQSELDIDVGTVRLVNVYTFDFELKPEELERIAKDLLTDIVIETYEVDTPLATGFGTLIEKGYRPGVTDNVANTARKIVEYAFHRKLIEKERIYFSIQYLFEKELTKEEQERVAHQILGNNLIEQFTYKDVKDWNPDKGTGLPVPRVYAEDKIKTEKFDLSTFSDDALMKLNRERCLAMSIEELHEIRKYFDNQECIAQRKSVGLGKKLTDAELETLAQTWSEHCKHKEFNATIEYTDNEAGKNETINSMFKTYIQGSTHIISERLKKRGTNWLVRVFDDNAGSVAFDKNSLFVWKVETHNSPSALDPYGGAITGIVGVNRDPAGTGMGGCNLLFNTNVFCFGDPFYKNPLPPNTLHPMKIFHGVYKGVEHGGNKCGIPTINGSLVFDNRYLGKPLVYCGTGGMMPRTIAGKDATKKHIDPGDLGIMAGGRVGKDGIHGATMSSEERHEGTPVTAVQIGDPITQKVMLDFIVEARDKGLIKAITDNGAGGLSSSFGEIAQISGGVEIQLEKVPLKYPGLQPWETFISESQERMSIVVAPEHLDNFTRLAAEREVEISVVATFTDTGYLDVKHGSQQVVYLDMKFLHDGAPKKHLIAEWDPPHHETPDFPQPKNLGTELKQILGRLNVCSKEYIVRQYDHEVKGKTIVKPLSGIRSDGPSDAGVILPSLDSYEGLIVSNGICPRYGDIDAYHMAACAFDEMVRQIIATGGKLPSMKEPKYDMWSVNDNFCTPDCVFSPENPDGKLKLAKLIRANQALYDCATKYNVPMTSGKDSMKNDFTYVNKEGETARISVPLTLLFSGAAKIDDVRKSITIDAKQQEDFVYVLGTTKNELGASEYFAMKGEEFSDAPWIGNTVPNVDMEAAMKLYTALSTATEKGLVASAHDCSDGGIAVSLAETAFAGGFGMHIKVRNIPISDELKKLGREDYILFSESQSRFVVTISPVKSKEFESIMDGNVFKKIGTVTKEPVLLLEYEDTQETIRISDLKRSWQQTLKFDLPEDTQ